MNAGERLALADAELEWFPGFLDPASAAEWFARVRDAIAWETHRIRIAGREYDSPRLSCWIGDPGTEYTYSRVRFEPRPWPAELATLRERVAAAAGERFNSALANRYRDGRDGMGWHADAEPELGPAPVIASLSLGAERRFVLRHRRLPLTRSIELGGGSLLVMRGTTQQHWLHALPKTRRPIGERINLTFRRILRPGELAGR
jgi:alkylated DNA repair dioxygenase AlkB